LCEELRKEQRGKRVRGEDEAGWECRFPDPQNNVGMDRVIPYPYLHGCCRNSSRLYTPHWHLLVNRW
jgi:hypothetical protein